MLRAWQSAVRQMTRAELRGGIRFEATGEFIDIAVVVEPLSLYELIKALQLSA